MTAMAGAISFTACPTCSPRRRTTSKAMAGSAASLGAKAPPIFRCCWSGTSRRSTPRPSPISRNSSPADDAAAPRGRARPLSSDPAGEEQAEPGAGAVIVDLAVGKMRGARLGARHLQAVMPARRPTVHHGVGHVGMKLQRVSAPVAKRLHLEHVAFGKKLGPVRQIEPLAVPLIDLLGPVIDHRKAGRGRPDRVIADLGVAGRMTKNPAAERPRTHLRAEADAEKRLLLFDRDGNPVDLAVDEFVRVIGAHRAAEDDGAGMIAQRLRQRIAEARPAHVEPVSELL